MKHGTDSFSGKGRDLMIKTNHSIFRKESTGQEIMVVSSEVPNGLLKNPRSKLTLQQLNPPSWDELQAPLWFTGVSTLELVLSTDGLSFHGKGEIDRNEN